MNFIEMAFLISENGEKVVDERVFSITTDKFKYVKNSDGQWEQKPIPPPVDNTQYLPIVPTEKKETK